MAEADKPINAYQQAVALYQKRTALRNGVIERLEEQIRKIQREALTFTEGGWDVYTVYGFEGDPIRIKEIVLRHPNSCWTTTVQRTAIEQVRLHRVMEQNGKVGGICQGNEAIIDTQDGYDAFIRAFIHSMSWHMTPKNT